MNKKLKKVKDDIKAYQELHNDWFDEYKSLGGKKNKKEFVKVDENTDSNIY